MVKGAANTRFLYDGDALVGEYDGSGALTNRYVHGSNAAADDPLVWYVGANLATARHLHADHLGSIVGITNCNASAPCIDAYDEYGVPGAANVGRFQYTEQAWLSELGLYYYKARMYSAALGRFLQTDPVGYGDQINLYDYVADDPVNSNDPTGWSLEICTGSRLCDGPGLASGVSGSSTISPTGRQTTSVDWGASPGRDAAGETQEDAASAQVACAGPVRRICWAIIAPVLRQIARKTAEIEAKRAGLTIARDARIGAGGRSGQNVPNLVGPPNAIVPKPSGNGYWVTDSAGKVVRDLSFGDTSLSPANRAKEVFPGRGIGPKEPITSREWQIWLGL